MKKILIADDEKEVLAILEKKLRQNNYDVRAVASGGEVIKSVQSEKPDLMLLDIAMPNIDGYALADTFNKDSSLRDIPIIFITGKEFLPQSIGKRAMELGVYDYIMKPCNFEDILAKIKKIIG